MYIQTFKEYCKVQEDTSYEDQIMAWMRTKGGEVVVVSALAKKFKVGDSAMLTLLNEMATSGKIRRAPQRNNRVMAFYVPTEGQLNAERRMAEEVRAIAPLKVDKHRRELYAQLAAARLSIPSIG